MAYFDRFDIVSAYYAFYCDYHNGQWSSEYRRMCKITDPNGSFRFTPGMMWKGYESLSENGQDIYDALVAKKEAYHRFC